MSEDRLSGLAMLQVHKNTDLFKKIILEISVNLNKGIHFKKQMKSALLCITEHCTLMLNLFITPINQKCLF